MLAQIKNKGEKIYESEDKSVLMYAIPKFGYYYLYSIGKVEMQNYKEGYIHLLEVAKKYQFNKVIFSLKDLTYTPLRGRAWFATYFAPLFYKLADNDLTVVIIKPQNKFEAVTIDIISNSLPKMGINVRTQFFEDEEKAIKWIENPIFD